MKWEKGEHFVIYGSKVGEVTEAALDVALRALGGSERGDSTLVNGSVFRCHQGCLRFFTGSCAVDPYVGGVQWWQGIRAEGVPGLQFELLIEDIVWSHTEVRLRVESEDQKLQSDLRQALEPVIEEARLGKKQ
mgnify:CR=1 FL=1